MAAIREMFLNEKNRFDLVAIPKEEKGGLAEKDAIVLCRYDTEGANWDGELKLSGHWESVRGSMEANVKEFTDGELVAAGVEETEAKAYIAVRESKWHADHDKAWDKVKQTPTFVNQSPKKYRTLLKDREGWWNVTKKGTPAPFEIGQYVLFMQAIEDVRTATAELNIDKPGGHISLKPFIKNREEKLKAMIGKCVRWELRPTPIA